MFTVLICIIILIIFVADSSTVISGASYGLMLWYKNVLPLLLPFMLISGIMIRHVSKLSNTSGIFTKRPHTLGVILTLFLGVLCGYPLGAKTSADFVKSDIYNTSTGNMLLPLCNNSSPMFISGYVIHNILHDQVSFFFAIFVIYLPYILLICLFTLSSKTKDYTVKNNNNADHIEDDTDYMLTAINQITFVGIYIMLCSIIIEFITRIPYIPNTVSTYISGLTEITRGLQQIKFAGFIDSRTKIALILAITSFGGVSSILQTNKVISKSGLSIIKYIVYKVICASTTFAIVMLLI